VTSANDYGVGAPPTLKDKQKTMTQAYKVVIKHDTQEGYVATLPELVDCQAQAKSLKTLMERICEVLAHHPDVDQPAATPHPALPDREPGAGKGDG
jgi:predicted RNase H-like HicB family nuclease